VVWLAASVRVVSEHQRIVVFRLGRFVGVYGPGLSLLIPLLDRAVPVDLREQVRKVEGEEVLTRDNSRVNVDLVWAYQVTDPAKAVLEVADLEAASQEMATTVLRSVIGDMARSDVLREREQVRSRIDARLREIVEPWGVELTTVEVREIRRY
jgi:regulator of protease activity HflC (stomatin/prohibitin superfamily)